MLIKRSCADVDRIAESILRTAVMAKEMPRAYEAHGIRRPVYSNPDEGTPELLGHILDGKGLYLDRDLKQLGIKKRIPFVYERSRTQRLIDKLKGDERAALTTYDGIVNARGGGKADDLVVTKVSYTTVANTWSCGFRAAGFPAAGAYSGTPGTAPDRSTTGALSMGLSNPSGSDSKYLLTFGLTGAQQINATWVVDLLVAVGAVTAASLAAQTVSSTALTRQTTGAGVYATLEVTTALGGTAANHTCSYTNQAGTAGQTSVSSAMTTSAIVQRLQPTATGPQINLASGDTGVRAVSTSTLSASMTAGVYAVLLYFPVIFFPAMAANIYSETPSSTTIDGLATLAPSSGTIGCLTTFFLTNTTSTGIVTMTMRTCAG